MLPPPTLVSLFPLQAAAPSPSAAAAAPPSSTKRPPPHRLAQPAGVPPGRPGVPAKRAGSPLAAPPGKQPRQEHGPEGRGAGQRDEERAGEGRGAGRFAALLRKGRRQESGDAEVAQLLRGAVQLRSSGGKKPLSADDILKAKAREQLIRQMQGRNGGARRGPAAAGGEGKSAGGAHATGALAKMGTGQVAREGGAAKLRGPESSVKGVVEREQRTKKEHGDAGQREGPRPPQLVHSNGGPPPVQPRGPAAAAAGTPSSAGLAAPQGDRSGRGPSAGPQPINVAAISALAHVLQGSSSLPEALSAVPPATVAPSRQSPGQAGPQPEPPAAGIPLAGNPLLAQLVAEVERQKQRERERRAREGPQAGRSAEAWRSAALLQQLEAHVATLVQQERRQAASGAGGKGGHAGGWARAVALMEDRAIPWQVPPGGGGTHLQESAIPF
jgi:hypothetical protein